MPVLPFSKKKNIKKVINNNSTSYDVHAEMKKNVPFINLDGIPSNIINNSEKKSKRNRIFKVNVFLLLMYYTLLLICYVLPLIPPSYYYHYYYGTKYEEGGGIENDNTDSSSSSHQAYLLITLSIKIGYLSLKYILMAFVFVSTIDVINMIGTGTTRNIYRGFTAYISTGIWYLLTKIGFFVIEVPLFISDLIYYIIFYYNFGHRYWIILICIANFISLFDYTLSVKLIYINGVLANLYKTLMQPNNIKNSSSGNRRRRRSSGVTRV